MGNIPQLRGRICAIDRKCRAIDVLGAKWFQSEHLGALPSIKMYICGRLKSGNCAIARNLSRGIDLLGGRSSLKILETLTSTGLLYDGGVGGSPRILRDRPGLLRDRPKFLRDQRGYGP